ncbi:MAG: phage tail protein, partial [Magnetospirillum sp.]
MTEVMMALGGYRFSLSTAAYQDLDRTNEYRWAAQERMGRRSARQFTGPGDETIALSGVILPHYRGGLGQLDAMRAEAGKGKPLMLVDGLGRVWGKYCIT